jgi:hypothetical protein
MNLIASNESFDLLVQYNEIKHRLDTIESYVKQIHTKKDDCASNGSDLVNGRHQSTNNANLYTSILTNGYSLLGRQHQHLTNNDDGSRRAFVTLLFIAWLIGLLSAISLSKFHSFFF